MPMPEQNCPPGKEYVFRTPEGKEIGKARNMREFVALLKAAPLASVLYHANGGHFAPWLEFMGQKMIAAKVRSVKGRDEGVRKSLISLMEQA